MKVWNLCVLLTILSPVGQALCAPIPHLRKPTVQVAQKVQYGTASWYGAKWQGRLMACGEPFDENALTAAHRTLPLGAEVKVTNLENGRSVNVRVKDRGPAITGRLIDLSKAAAVRLGFVHRGLTPVKVQVVRMPSAEPTRTLAATDQS
jgi:rare lipoprotein A